MSLQVPINLANCDIEPIHIPGSIQPHGAMLVCDSDSFQILFASGNAAAFLGSEVVLLSGADLATVLGEQLAHDLRNAIAKAAGAENTSVLLDISLFNNPESFDLTVHRHDNRVIIEFERSAGAGKTAQDALNLTQTLVRRIGRENNVDDIATSGAKLVRVMLGYDRVMVYRFLHNGAGRVIAEAKRADLNSFMDQHFPASDIPYQARRLYLENTIRMIGDSHYSPVALYPELKPGESAVDMSFAHLRSVSPIHCEYLQNMGVKASMSISIIAEGELWGLISCHHESAKIVPLPLRIGAELFGRYFSLQMAMTERRTQILASSLARSRLDKIVAELSTDDSLTKNLRDHLEEIASLIECDGIALWTDRNWYGCGIIPAKEAVDELMAVITAEAKSAVWHTHELRSHMSSDALDPSIAGVLAIPLSSTPRDYLLLFRREEAHSIKWAGEPIKNVVETAEGARLTPRGSFKIWQEDVKGRSKPWTDAEQAVAEAIGIYVRDVVLRHNELTAEERTRTEQRRRILNDELNHRVKNIIALVKSIALQTGAHAATVAEYAASLEGRLRALAYAHDQSLSAGRTGDLTSLIDAEAGLYRHDGAPDRVALSGPKVRLDDRAFGVIALVVHEMMTNAAKYGALSVPQGRVELRWEFNAEGSCEISWIEIGGPAVEVPTRVGFGTKLIRNTMSYDLGGSSEVIYAPAGVCARWIIPSDHASIDESSSQSNAETVLAPAPLAGLSILVVEDQALIAMDTEDTLRQLGANSIRLAPNAAEAFIAIGTFKPDVAVLDFNLGSSTAEGIADELTKLDIPFIFATGYGDNVTIPDRFRNTSVIGKPVNSILLGATLAAAITERRTRP